MLARGGAPVAGGGPPGQRRTAQGQAWYSCSRVSPDICRWQPECGAALVPPPAKATHSKAESRCSKGPGGGPEHEGQGTGRRGGGPGQPSAAAAGANSSSSSPASRSLLRFSCSPASTTSIFSAGSMSWEAPEGSAAGLREVRDRSLQLQAQGSAAHDLRPTCETQPGKGEQTADTDSGPVLPPCCASRTAGCEQAKHQDLRLSVTARSSGKSFKQAWKLGIPAGCPAAMPKAAAAGVLDGLDSNPLAFLVAPEVS